MPLAGASLSLTALNAIPRIREGDDIAAILGDTLDNTALAPKPHDVLVVTHKIISKAEGRCISLADIVPSKRAMELAAATGKDPALVEVILSESRSILRFRPGLIITEHRLGMVMANAGIDQSNVAYDERHVLLLPIDPDGSAAALRDRLQTRFRTEFAVIICDSVGRAWRQGVV
ncbi:MAG: coenzyme F420-0:L-glutamate ligase, partial [Geminicoccaceae bacterium]